MDDDRKDDVKNGFSSELSSPKSTSSNDTSVSNLQPSSAYHPLDESMTKSAQSKSSRPSSSVLSDLTPDSAKESVAADYSGTRFVVKRTDSSELQSPVLSSSNSLSRVDRASSQSPKSVKFVVEETAAGPSRGKSPQKSSSLTKSLTSNALVKLLEPRKLFSQKSQDSFPSKEEIELPSINPGKDLSPNNDTSDDDKDLCDTDVAGDSSESSRLLDRPQSINVIDVQGPDGIVASVPVEEIPNTPELPSSEATTASGERHCQQLIFGSIVCYFGITIFIIVTFVGCWWFLVYFGLIRGNSTTNETLISANKTENSTMPFTLDALNLDQKRQEFDKLLFTVPETTTDAFSTDEFTTDAFTTDAFTTDADTMATTDVDIPTTTTNTPYFNVLTTDASTTAETTTHRND